MDICCSGINFVKMFNNHVEIKNKASFKIKIHTKRHWDSVGSFTCLPKFLSERPQLGVERSKQTPARSTPTLLSTGHIHICCILLNPHNNSVDRP